MIDGKRIKLSKWISGDRFAVRVFVDAVIPVDDQSEPCLEPDTIRFLDSLQQLADAGDVEELERFGEVFIRKSA